MWAYFEGSHSCLWVMSNHAFHRMSNVIEAEWHICVSKLTIIGSVNGLSPGRRQAIIWTNAGILLIRPLATNFSEISIKIHTFSFKKMHLKMLSGKCRPFCFGLNVLVDSHRLVRFYNNCYPGIHFINDFCIFIQIQSTFDLILLHILMNWSLQYFAHDLIAQLASHVKIFAAIS